MFEEGDLIECLASAGDNLTKGKIYKVLASYGDYVSIVYDKGTIGGWYSYRFKLVPKIYDDGLDNWE